MQVDEAVYLEPRGVGGLLKPDDVLEFLVDESAVLGCRKKVVVVHRELRIGATVSQNGSHKRRAGGRER